MLDFDFFELLDSVTIARSRKHIQAFYDTTEIGAFPERLPPVSIRAPLTDLPGVASFNEIFEQIQELTLAVYTPLAYVFPSRLQQVRRPLQREGRHGALQLRPARPRARPEEAHDRQPAQAAGELGRSVPSHRSGRSSAVDKTLGRLETRAGAMSDVDVEFANLDL